jgi:glycosyltransferase involved in cell wall biosynthesis
VISTRRSSRATRSSETAGVNVVGYVNDVTGLGQVARLLITALEHRGIPHTVLAVGARSLRERLRPTKPLYDTNIVCVNAQLLPGFVEAVGRSLLQERRTIGFWWWEVQPFPPVMAWASHLVDELWVGSVHVKRMIEASVSKPIHVFPLPIVRPSVEVLTRRELGIPEGRFAFVFSFNFWSVFERKNPLGLLEAFSRAFAPNEGPILVMKTIRGSTYPVELARLRAAAAARPDVLVIDRAVAPAQYHGLVAACDAYASLHRAEGFGLTIAEAMALGKPAVATAYSGNVDFMTGNNSYLAPYELVPVPAGLEPYAAGGLWAEPDLDAAAALLRRIVDQPDEARVKTSAALADFKTQRGFNSAAAFVRDRLANPAPRSEIPVDPIERAAYELMWGPDLENARWWARRLRQIQRPFLRPYVDYQRSVGALLLDALRRSDAHVGRRQTSPADNSQRDD